MSLYNWNKHTRADSPNWGLAIDLKVWRTVFRKNEMCAVLYLTHNTGSDGAEKSVVFPVSRIAVLWLINRCHFSHAALKIELLCII